MEDPVYAVCARAGGGICGQASRCMDGLRRGRLERGFRLAAEGGEGGRVVDGEVGQDLAVQLDTGLLQAADEYEISLILAAALMRTIQIDRYWRFLPLRPL